MSTAQSAYNASDWQEYWESWLQTQQEFIRAQMKGMQGLHDAQALQTRWENFFREWKNNLGGSVPGAGAYQQFFAQAGEQFLQMLQQFYQGAGDDKPAGDIAAEWLGAMQSFFAELQEKSGQGFDPVESWKSFQENIAKAAPAWAALFQPMGFHQSWGIPGWNTPAWGPAAWHPPGWNPQDWMAQGFGPAAGPWQQQAAQPFMNPQNWQMPNWQQGFKAAGAQGLGAFDPFGFYAAMPGIGYTREKQEELGRLYRHWADFEAQAGKYNAAMAQVGLEAVRQFQHYLSNPPAEAAPLHSLKDVYGKWVDVCEDVYAKYALSDDYTRVYGEVVNALMGYKKQLNGMIDGLAAQMNLPTRQEVDSLHKRVHELRRDNIRLKKDMAEIQAGLNIQKPAAAPAAPVKPAPKKAPAAVKKAQTKKAAAKKSTKKGK
jgi:hypothetical protein